MDYRIDELKGDMTLTELATKLGCSRSHLQQIKAGKKAPGDKLLKKMAEILGVTVPELYADYTQEVATIPCMQEYILPFNPSKAARMTQRTVDDFMRRNQIFDPEPRAYGLFLLKVSDVYARQIEEGYEHPISETVLSDYALAAGLIRE